MIKLLEEFIELINQLYYDKGKKLTYNQTHKQYIFFLNAYTGEKKKNWAIVRSFTLTENTMNYFCAKKMVCDGHLGLKFKYGNFSGVCRKNFMILRNASRISSEFSKNIQYKSSSCPISLIIV
jgi:hypothetical protein